MTCLLALLASVHRSSAVDVHAAALRVVPTNAGILAPGDELDLRIEVINESLTSVSQGTDIEPVELTLGGTVRIDLGCTNDDCSERDASALEFLPLAPTGCVSSVPGSACSTHPSGVEIALPAEGVLVPPTARLELARVRIKVATPSHEQVGIRASTSTQPLLLFSADLGWATSGATVVFFATPPAPTPTPAPTPGAARLQGCPGLCRSHIRFPRSPERLDLVEIHGVAEADDFAAADLTSLPIAVAVASELRGIFVREHLDAGNLVRDGRTALYRSPAAKHAGGIESLRLTRLEGSETRLRIDARIFADVESLATEASMEVRVDVGESAFTSIAQWSRTPRGWYVDLPD